MFLKDLNTRGLIEVLELKDVFDPFSTRVRGRTQVGEDTMDEVEVDKAQLTFPSGEVLPRCWRDSHYRRHG